MLKIRRSQDRGHFDHGWLDTRHTFSFAGYFDPEQRGFRTLRVINEDRVQPGRGFAPHDHRDMEIISYVLSGALAHEDSLGNRSTIRAGELQRMSAGSGVTHSEFNPSESEPVRFFQIWIYPRQKGTQPSYEQRAFPAAERRGRLELAVSPDGRDESLGIDQDVELYLGSLEPGQEVEHAVRPGRHAWVQVARGGLELNGETLHPGDGAAISDEPALEFRARDEAEILVFDLA